MLAAGGVAAGGAAVHVRSVRLCALAAAVDGACLALRIGTASVPGGALAGEPRPRCGLPI